MHYAHIFVNDIKGGIKHVSLCVWDSHCWEEYAHPSFVIVLHLIFFLNASFALLMFFQSVMYMN